MNVGPTARGNFDKRADNALNVFAEWMKYNARSIYGCTAADPVFKAPNGTVLTQSADGKRLYLHLLQQAYSRLIMDLPADRVEYVQLLSDASELSFATTHHSLISPETTVCARYPLKRKDANPLCRS